MDTKHKNSDQIIEHSYRMLNKLKYKLEMADSVKAAKKQHAGIFIFTFCSCSAPLNAPLCKVFW